MNLLRTPEERFDNLIDFPFSPHYREVDGIRIHHVDEGPDDGEVVLMLHGEPSWSFLYRHMIPLIAAAGHRAIAPDLVGFGRSDKPAAREDYTYQRHVDWMAAWLLRLDLRRITLVCQDWGSLIGLRLVAGYPERFSRVVVANGGLPIGTDQMNDAFQNWLSFSQNAPQLPIGNIINMGTSCDLSPAVIAGYEAPFPDESYKEGARIFPALVPITPDSADAKENRLAWRTLRQFDRPFLTAFSDQDPITAGGDAALQRLIRGAKGQPHTTIQGAGHFLQEDKGPELAQVVLDFISRNG